MGGRGEGGGLEMEACIDGEGQRMSGEEMVEEK